MFKANFILILSLAVVGICLARRCGPDPCSKRDKSKVNNLKISLEKFEDSCDGGVHYKNCAEIQEAGNTVDGVYTIYPDSSSAVEAYCDLTTDGGGWTVFQKRIDGSIDFYRGLAEYTYGFGDPATEYWLGLNNMRALVKQYSQELRVDLEDFEGERRFAKYSVFFIGDGDHGYILRVGGYSGTAGDALTKFHLGKSFSTKDNDMDFSPESCASKYKGAWWYGKCHESNLNGQYFEGGTHESFADGINWESWKGYYYSMKTTQMKIRPAGMQVLKLQDSVFK